MVHESIHGSHKIIDQSTENGVKFLLMNESDYPTGMIEWDQSIKGWKLNPFPGYGVTCPKFDSLNEAVKIHTYISSNIKKDH